MTHLSALLLDLDQLATHPGRVVVFADPDAPLPRATKRCDRLTKGALARAVGSAEFGALAPGKDLTLAYPVGMKARGVADHPPAAPRHTRAVAQGWQQHRPRTG